jgi:hypothetical protein
VLKQALGEQHRYRSKYRDVHLPARNSSRNIYLFALPPWKMFSSHFPFKAFFSSPFHYKSLGLLKANVSHWLACKPGSSLSFSSCSHVTYYSALTMEAAGYSETLTRFYLTTCNHIPKNHKLRIQSRTIHISHEFFCTFPQPLLENGGRVRSNTSRSPLTKPLHAQRSHHLPILVYITDASHLTDYRLI